MSCDDYDQFIIQKCRLAVAIAVLKTKPTNTSTKEYLNQLRDKINDKNLESDDDITICEDDFNFDDNDSVLNCFDDNDSNDSVTILKNFDFNHLGDTVAKPTNDSSFLNVMQILNNIENPVYETVANTNISQSTYFDGSQNIQNVTPINEDNTALTEDLILNNDIENKKTTENELNTDSQQTELYTLRDFAEYNTHYSQSQDDFVISRNLILNNNKVNDFKVVTNVTAIDTSLSNAMSGNTPIFHGSNHLKALDSNIPKDASLNNDETGYNDAFDNVNNIANDKRKFDVLNNEKHNKRTKMDLNTSQNCSNDVFLTQFSSQSNNNSRMYDTSLDFDFMNTLNSNKDSNSQMIREKIRNFDNFGNQEANDEEIAINKIKSKDVIKPNSYSLDEFEYNTQSQSFNINNSANDKSNNNYNYISQNLKETNSDNIRKNRIDKNVDFDNIIEKDDDSSNSEKSSDLTESQAEIVTFKVLNELGKVKSYLNRRERLGKSDSGYRSFQQRHSGDSASQSSGVWINESAHSLMSFITTSPLVMSTVEITEEISKVLGKLIDQLHEDEIYPNFLEELLETVDKLLNLIYEGRNYGENILIKDENIQRIFLLNRSLHIIKHSIEKITIILENTLQNLSDTFELQHTDKSENICYIFYILEDLLKRHNNQQKNISSQNSSQLSQEEKILKKSSLTEIWRKKWNLSKSEIFEGSSEKVCVLTKCRDVLNKMIVQAMEGYSLMSYAALQCFNLLQD